MKKYTYSDLVKRLEDNGCNLADIAVGRMMDIVFEETENYPKWNDVAPEWVVENCIMYKRRYFAKKVNGKGYIFDKQFSDKVPIAVETTIEFARAQVDKFNREEQKEGKRWS